MEDSNAYTSQVSLTEVVTPIGEIIEEAIVNLEYYNLICKNQLLDCNICLGLLNDPIMCEQCQTPFCKTCITIWRSKNNKCPFGCTVISFVPITRSLKAVMDGLIIKCISCGNITSLYKYPEHKQQCFKLSCFNCGSVVSKKSLNIKEDESNRFVKFSYEPNAEMGGHVCFQIYIWTDKYTGFICSSKKGWMKLTRKRSTASMFSFYFNNMNMHFQIFYNSKWVDIQPHYDCGVGVFNVFSPESINYDFVKQKLISNSGRTLGYPLTLRKTDFYFYFFAPSELYIECNAKLVYCNE